MLGRKKLALTGFSWALFLFYPRLSVLQTIRTLFDEIDYQDPSAVYVYLGVFLVPFWAQVRFIRVPS